MLATRSRWTATVTTAVATLALAGAAALALGVADVAGSRSDRAEALSTAAWLLGWTLLAWATVLGLLGAAQLLRRRASHRGPTWSEVLLVVASCAAVAAVVLTHPVVGSGSGAASRGAGHGIELVSPR